MPTFASLSQRTTRVLSSAGSEHLPYKQRVGGSNPSAPTKKIEHYHRFASEGNHKSQAKAYARVLSSAGSEHLPYKQRVGGSNPSAPTRQKSHTKLSCGIFFTQLYT